MRDKLTKLVFGTVTKSSEDDKGNGMIEGYASTFERDLVGDRIAKGAYVKTIKERVDTGRVRLMDNHETYGTLSNTVLGIVETAEEDNHGLFIKARFASTPEAQNMRTLCKEGMLKDFSVGIGIVKDSWDALTNSRLIEECRLHEVSIVASPANPGAVMHAVKSTSANHYFGVAPADTPFNEVEAVERFTAWAKKCPSLAGAGSLYHSQETKGLVTRFQLVDIVENVPVLVPAAILKAYREITVGKDLPLGAEALLSALKGFADRAQVTLEAPVETPTDNSAEQIAKMFEDLRGTRMLTDLVSVKKSFRS